MVMIWERVQCPVRSALSLPACWPDLAWLARHSALGCQMLALALVGWRGWALPITALAVLAFPLWLGPTRPLKSATSN